MYSLFIKTAITPSTHHHESPLLVYAYYESCLSMALIMPLCHIAFAPDAEQLKMAPGVRMLVNVTGNHDASNHPLNPVFFPTEAELALFAPQFPFVAPRPNWPARMVSGAVAGSAAATSVRVW